MARDDDDVITCTVELGNDVLHLDRPVRRLRGEGDFFNGSAGCAQGIDDEGLLLAVGFRTGGTRPEFDNFRGPCKGLLAGLQVRTGGGGRRIGTRRRACGKQAKEDGLSVASQSGQGDLIFP